MQNDKVNNFKDFNGFKPTDFEKHIRASIPNYTGMRNLLIPIAKYFLPKDSNVYDIGCSSGDLLLELQKEINRKDLSYVGYDIADNLLPNLEYAPQHSFFVRDVTDPNLKMYNTSLVFSLFTLQFIQFRKRKDLVNKIYKSLNKRGAFIVCEKVFSSDGFTEDMFTFSNYDFKSENGISAKEILSKQRLLREKMYPLTQEENEKIFKEAGFHTVKVFWKSLNFIGWVLIK